MTTPDPIVTFQGGVTRAKTMADGSPRFEFEAGEDAIDCLSILARAQSDKRYLYVMIFDADEWFRFEKNQSDNALK